MLISLSLRFYFGQRLAVSNSSKIFLGSPENSLEMQIAALKENFFIQTVVKWKGFNFAPIHSRFRICPACTEAAIYITTNVPINCSLLVVQAAGKICKLFQSAWRKLRLTSYTALLESKVHGTTGTCLNKHAQTCVPAPSNSSALAAQEAYCSYMTSA